VRGGIIIPDTAKEKPQEGEVIAVGSGKLRDDGSRTPQDVDANPRRYHTSNQHLGKESTIWL